MGYSDRTDQSTLLSNVAGGNVYTLQAMMQNPSAVGTEQLSVWIDFNDNGLFEASEQLISGAVFDTFNELVNFTLTIPTDAALGSHTLRARAIDTAQAGDINDPCGNYWGGETQDYTVVIVDVLGTNDNALSEGNFTITSIDQKHFDLRLNAEVEGTVYVSIYNMLGQQLKFKTLSKVGDSYAKKLDMSSMASGVYIIKVGALDANVTHVKRILVK